MRLKKQRHLLAVLNALKGFMGFCPLFGFDLAFRLATQPRARGQLAKQEPAARRDLANPEPSPQRLQLIGRDGPHCDKQPKDKQR